MKILSVNKRANFDYEISQTYQAGLVLYGHEVKSIKMGHISLKGAFVVIKRGSGRIPALDLINAHVPLYKYASNVKEYDPTRSRRLLLKKGEIAYLLGKAAEQGLTLVPIKIYTERSLIKLQFGIGRGKKKYDKREDIKRRDAEREMKRAVKRKN